MMIAVRAGAPKPDISSVEGVKRALLAATSIAYSDSANGVYVETELFRRLGIEDAVKAKSRMIPADTVGQVVARGEAELGFQQISELMRVAGIELVGKLPPELQKITVFAAGIRRAAGRRRHADRLPGLAGSRPHPGEERTGADCDDGGEIASASPDSKYPGRYHCNAGRQRAGEPGKKDDPRSQIRRKAVRGEFG